MKNIIEKELLLKVFQKLHTLRRAYPAESEVHQK